MEAVSLQRMLLARLEAAEAAVLATVDISPSEFNSRCTHLAETNPEVKKLVTGMRQMYEDAMQGTLPLLPGLEVPEELTQERVLQILHKIQRRKEEKFRQILQATTERELSPEGATAAVTAQLQESNTEAERSVLLEEQLLLYHERMQKQQQQKQQKQQQQQVELTPMVFLQAIATHCRDPEFKAKKAAVDQSHSEHIFDLLRRGRMPQRAEPVVVACDKRLQQSTWPELSLRLESCEGMDAYVLCLVAPATPSSSSSSSSSSSCGVSAPLNLLEELSIFLEEGEAANWALDQLTPICLDTAEMPQDAGVHAPLREAVSQYGHCFALFKGQTLKGISPSVNTFKKVLEEAIGSSSSSSTGSNTSSNNSSSNNIISSNSNSSNSITSSSNKSSNNNLSISSNSSSSNDSSSNDNSSSSSKPSADESSGVTAVSAAADAATPQATEVAAAPAAAEPEAAAPAEAAPAAVAAAEPETAAAPAQAAEPAEAPAAEPAEATTLTEAAAAPAEAEEEVEATEAAKKEEATEGAAAAAAAEAASEVPNSPRKIQAAAAAAAAAAGDDDDMTETAAATAADAA
ncbi:hypothetical protein, conserved [Eimeria maxima]|uniref:Uncharacterized protein n=1 Tax=Eimeria maxima TaxID=5804 RepID=U6LY98_EIMMA|nr:hypothetical protein, conserved [Eimeria maxima]CDJ56711.1 hypothetical protein, conserved [Eimeria maxima]